MDLKKLIETRYSCRKYKPDPIDEDTLNEVLDAGRMAPTAVNKQPFVFLVVNKKEKLDALYEAYPREWFATAPCVIVICADHSASWKRGNDGKDHANIDAAIATDHMTLRAAELGLGTCWVCNFDPTVVTKKFNLPGHLEPAVLLPVGKPGEAEIPPKKRKSLSQLVRFNEY